MVAPRVKFRCVHCDRLLSAAANRVGRAIACPKCVQATTVPMIGAGSELELGLPRKPRVEIPEEILAIQPEDIRAEIPSLGINLAPEDRTEIVDASAPSEEWAFPIDPSPSPEAEEREEIHAESWFTQAETPSTPEPIAEKLPPSLEVQTVPAPSLASDLPVRRGGYLTLPASVVLAWSVFVLVAQTLAFLAGLFIGHYYWKHL